MTMTDNPPVSEYFENCPIGRIHPDPINPRTHVDIDDDFTASVAAGIIEPLIVRPDPAKATLLGEPEDFLIVAGERRHAAATAAELETVPVIVRHDLADDADALEAMIIENGHRSDLPPLDEARAFATLVEKGRSQREIARAVGREQGTVSKRLSLLKLPVRAQQLLDEQRITIQTALGMTGLIKDNGRLSKVLDFAAGGRDDHDIAQYTFRLLQDVKDEADKAKRAKAVEKKLTELRAGDLEEKTEDDLDGHWEQCEADDPDVKVFVQYDSWDGSLDIEYYRPLTDVDEDDTVERAEETAAEREQDEAARLARDTAAEQRKTLVANLANDGYPDVDTATMHALRMFAVDFIGNNIDDYGLAELLGINDVPDEGSDQDESDVLHDRLLYSAQHAPIRTAFCVALVLGQNMFYEADVQRQHLAFLESQGYACDLPEERALFGDTTPDGNYEDESADRLVGEEEPVTPAKVGHDIPDAELHDVADNVPCHEGHRCCPGETPGEMHSHFLDAAECPDCDTFEQMGTTAAAEQTYLDVEEPVELEEPFKAYNAFPVKSILNIINNPDTDTQRLQAVVTYETANRADTKILDAARARLDALAVAS